LTILAIALHKYLLYFVHRRQLNDRTVMEESSSSDKINLSYEDEDDQTRVQVQTVSSVDSNEYLRYYLLYRYEKKTTWWIDSTTYVQVLRVQQK
jgi:hypothetical protein